MSVSQTNVLATLLADGLTLRLEEKLALPPGRVSVTIKNAETDAGPTMLEVLQRIHQEQSIRGRPAMTEQEMTAEISHIRNGDEDYEERWRQIWSQTSQIGD